MNIHHGALFPDYLGYTAFINKEWEDITTTYATDKQMFDLKGDVINEEEFKKTNGIYRSNGEQIIKGNPKMRLA